MAPAGIWLYSGKKPQMTAQEYETLQTKSRTLMGNRKNNVLSTSKALPASTFIDPPSGSVNIHYPLLGMLRTSGIVSESVWLPLYRKFKS